MRRHLLLSFALALVGGASAQATDTVRLGYFPNLTHAAALVGIERGYFQKELGKVKLDAKTFVAGTALNEAFAAGQIDIAYIGPGPAINGAARGLPMQVVAGASNAGAVLVARTDAKITSAKDLAGKRVAVPTLGNTQDISLRHLLKENGLKAQADGGNVTIVPVAPADVAAAFATKQVDAALVPEPWGALLESRGGRVVGSHKSIWRDGDYPTTLLVVNTQFATKNPDLVRAFLRGHVAAVRFVNTSRPAAQASIARQLQKLTGEKIDARVLQRALARTQISIDFNLEALREYGDLNKEAGYTRTLPEWAKLVDLGLVKSIGGRP